MLKFKPQLRRRVMFPPLEQLITEIEQEAASTRRLLERVPEDKLTWKPHTKSMSLGQLAFHVASTPGQVGDLLKLDGMDAKQAKLSPPEATSSAQLLSTLDGSIKNATQILQEMEEKEALGPWRLSNGDQEVFTMPRVGMARTIMLNHWYHHRGQLTVYLRLLDVPLPATYGRSADHNPFA